MRPRRACAAAVTAALLLGGSPSRADSVRVTVPVSVGFAVTNVSASTTGTPNPTAFVFNSLTTTGGRVLRVSIKADSDFVPPGGTAIPASRVSWTTTGATNGTGSAGVLSTTTYRQVYQSNPSRRNGSVGIRWTLAPVGTPVRAGSHVLVVRWRLESITP